MANPIKAYREARSLTQKQLGELVGVEKAAVSKWEHGNGPSAVAAIRIERATGGKLPRWKTRPDLWSRPPKGRSSTHEASQ